jgi:nucleoside-diphosphate-sugar epimerase
MLDYAASFSEVSGFEVPYAEVTWYILLYYSLIGRHPNTYTFSKQLTEHLLASQRGHVKVAIVRPSIGEHRILLST